MSNEENSSQGSEVQEERVGSEVQETTEQAVTADETLATIFSDEIADEIATTDTADENADETATEETGIKCRTCPQMVTGPKYAWLPPLNLIEQAIREKEGFKRWAREGDLRDHVLCGPCGHELRKIGHKIYHYPDTAAFLVTRKAEADAGKAERRREMTATKFGELYDLTLISEQPRQDGGRYAKGKKQKKVKVRDKRNRDEE